MFEIFVKYFFLLLAGLVIFYLFGSLIFYFLKIKIQNQYADAFSKFTLGMIIFVIAVSFFFTKLKTINLGFIILIAAFLIEYFRKKKSVSLIDTPIIPNPTSLRLLIELAVVSLLLFCFKFFFIYSSTGTPQLPEQDYVIYSNLSNFLMETGKENTTYDYVYTAETGLSAYHYFEIWQNVGLSSIFHVNTLLCLLLVTYTSGTIIIWLGFCALFSKFQSITLFHKIACFLFLFLAGVNLKYYTQINFMENIGVFSVNAINYYKLFPIYIISLGSLLLFLKKENTYGILLLLSLPIISISTAIGVFSSVFFFLFYRYYKKGVKLGLPFIAMIILAGFILLFYSILSKGTITHVTISPTSLKNKSLEFFHLKTSINVIGATIIQLILLYSPIIFILFFIKKLNIRKLIQEHSFLLLFSFILTFSLIGWAALHTIAGSVQIFSNISIVVLNISCAVIFIFTFLSKNKKEFFLGLTIFSFILIVNLTNTFKSINATQEYSANFLNQIYNTSPHLSPRGAFLLDKTDYKRINFSYLSGSLSVGGYLAYLPYKTFPLSISPHDFNFSNAKLLASIEKEGIISTPFYKYVELQKVKGKFKNINSSRLDFIDEYKINYLITTKNVVLDSLLLKKVKESIIDEKSGERFYLLN